LSEKPSYNLPIIIIIFAVAIGLLLLFNMPPPAMNNEDQVIEEPEPVVEPVPEPVVEPVPEPVVEPVPEPVVEPVPEPVVEEVEIKCPFGQDVVAEKCEFITLENGGKYNDVRLTINNDLFEQPIIQVKKGTTVTWLMQDKQVGAGGDVAYHQVKERNGLFDSGPMAVIGSTNTFSYTFNEIGEFDYICPPHPWMEGKVIVVE
jgi:plastocyanin